MGIPKRHQLFSPLLGNIWRELNGDNAYQRYLTHWHLAHAESEQAPLSRKAFFAAQTKRKWHGVKRCC
ncbi:YbdD/YjiX family protein [Methylomonas rhizoryzae]|uniref:YbdD/YjiX family protein n=1 Tax=Methylomonas rhizoryzae TaxID=2608981 RepID=UPI001232F270|nr:YbdD/YjiX family protein [Methylomonas rhizoryzae]